MTSPPVEINTSNVLSFPVYVSSKLMEYYNATGLGSYSFLKYCIVYCYKINEVLITSIRMTFLDDIVHILECKGITMWEEGQWEGWWKKKKIHT